MSSRKRGEKKKKKKKEGISTPPMGAGLLIFYEEETPGVKVGPGIVLMLAFGLVFFVLMLWFLVPPK